MGSGIYISILVHSPGGNRIGFPEPHEEGDTHQYSVYFCELPNALSLGYYRTNTALKNELWAKYPASDSISGNSLLRLFTLRDRRCRRICYGHQALRVLKYCATPFSLHLRQTRQLQLLRAIQVLHEFRGLHFTFPTLPNVRPWLGRCALIDLPVEVLEWLVPQRFPTFLSFQRAPVRIRQGLLSTARESYPAFSSAFSPAFP